MYEHVFRAPYPCPLGHAAHPCTYCIRTYIGTYHHLHPQHVVAQHVAPRNLSRRPSPPLGHGSSSEVAWWLGKGRRGGGSTPTPWRCCCSFLRPATKRERYVTPGAIHPKHPCQDPRWDCVSANPGAGRSTIRFPCLLALLFPLCVRSVLLQASFPLHHRHANASSHDRPSPAIPPAGPGQGPGFARSLLADRRMMTDPSVAGCLCCCRFTAASFNLLFTPPALVPTRRRAG